MRKEVLCTLGPSSLNKSTINRLEALGVNMFRINMSHTNLSDLPNIVKLIRNCSDVPICFDSEGAQIRTSAFKEENIFLKENEIVSILLEPTVGDNRSFNLYPRESIKHLEIGDFISIDFNSVLGRVVAGDSKKKSIKILSGGKVGKNKAVTIEKSIKLSPFTNKDLETFKIGTDLGIKHYALSFANSESDVLEMRKKIPTDSFLISKVECREALKNLEGIIRSSDAILIDRGDLSREEPIERIPFLQKMIISETKAQGKKVYVATNLLESMIKDPIPTRAEVNDIYNTLLDGADGLVLAAETAIGNYPIQTVRMVNKVIHEYNQTYKLKKIFKESLIKHSSLVPPHGGELNESFVDENHLDAIDSYKKIEVSDIDLMDAQQICIGTYSPLTGFMTNSELDSVLNEYKTTEGVSWTLPIVLQLSQEKLENVKVGDNVVLTDKFGQNYFVLNIQDIYQPDLEEVAAKWYGTNSHKHPGVDCLLKGGSLFVGGELKLINKINSIYKEYELSPKESRFLFDRKGWSRVVAFHSRNVMHRAHEFIQKKALKNTHADGLYLSPVIGPKKKGDFRTDVILKSYQMMIDLGVYPENQVVLGAFSTYSRYAGPREAVFTALCRKNMGCSHFIIGRDHTGVGNFYAADANKKLFDKLGDIGIEPVFFDTVGYNNSKGTHELVTGKNNLQSLSGTEVRSFLQENKRLPSWFIRDEIQDMLFTKMVEGNNLFH